MHVWLDISGQDEPPAVLLSVTDGGPGAPAGLWQRVPIAPPGADAPAMPERGPVLFIVRRVMALRGGRLTTSMPAWVRRRSRRSRLTPSTPGNIRSRM